MTKLINNLEEFIEMLESDIELVRQGKSKLTAEQILVNIKNDLVEILESGVK